MKTQAFTLKKYEADEGKVFDWADLTAHTHEEQELNDEGQVINTITVQEHLYAKVVFIGPNDNINNYIEVNAPQEGE